MPEEPRAKQQHPVPQELFSVKFKLVGNLTLRQFGLMAGFGLLAYLFFASGIFIVLRLLISGFFLLAGIAFAFVPVQDQPLDRWLVAFFRAIYAPTRRIWAKSAEPAEFLVLEVPKIARTAEPEVTAEESRRRLKRFLETVKEGTELSPLDLEEQKYLKAINALAREISPPPAPPVAEAVRPPEQKLAPTTPGEAASDAVEPPKPPVPAPIQEKAAPPVLPKLKFIEVRKIQREPSLASKINWTTEKVYKVQRGEAASYFAARRTVRVGRRLTPLAISGEVVYAPVRERIIEPELPKPPQLLPAPAAVMPIPTLPPPPPPPPPAKPQPAPEAPPKPEEKPAAPAEKPVEPPLPPPKLPELSVKKQALPKSKGRPAPELTEQSNILSGTVYDLKGGVFARTLVIIKDVKGNVVRAIKTNDLGKFSTTPLPNGHYSLEVPRTPASFATMKIELTGEKMKELEIKPKS